MRESERLAAYLKKRDAPCPGCGGNLRGVTIDRCPSCDEALTVTKVIYHAPRASWAGIITGFMGLLAGSAMLAMVWPMIMDRPRWRQNDFTRWDVIHLLLIGATLGMVTLLALWTNWSDEMRCRPARFRWGWAAACWGTVPVAWALGFLLDVIAAW